MPIEAAHNEYDTRYLYKETTVSLGFAEYSSDILLTKSGERITFVEFKEYS